MSTSCRKNEIEKDRKKQIIYERKFCNNGKIVNYKYFDEKCSKIEMIIIEYPIC